MEMKSQLMGLPCHRMLKSDAIPYVFPLHFKEEGIRSLQQKIGQAESPIPSTSSSAPRSSCWSTEQHNYKSRPPQTFHIFDFQYKQIFCKRSKQWVVRKVYERLVHLAVECRKDQSTRSQSHSPLSPTFLTTSPQRQSLLNQLPLSNIK